MDIRSVSYVRIEPMSLENEEFIGKNYLEVQKDFFAGKLIDENSEHAYTYYYDTRGISQEMNDYNVLILFQMSGAIIASALLGTVTHFPNDYKLQHPELNGSNGMYILKKNSIHVFEPIDEVELKQYIDNFKKFGENRLVSKAYQVNLDGLNNRINDNDEYKNKLLAGQISI